MTNSKRPAQTVSMTMVHMRTAFRNIKHMSAGVMNSSAGQENNVLLIETTKPQ